MATSASDVPQSVEEPRLAHKVYVASDILGAATHLSLLSDDEYDDVLEDTDHKDCVMAEPKVDMLTEKQKMQSRAVEECEKIQRERIEIAEKLKEREQREPHSAAVLGDLSDGQQNVYELLVLRRRATLSVREAGRGFESVSSSPTNPPDPVETQSVWKLEKGPAVGREPAERRLLEEKKSATSKWMTKPEKLQNKSAQRSRGSNTMRHASMGMVGCKP